ncbi:hypothetical protein [Gramella sp. MAR_2010_147]|uniref:cytidylyltransferase domain-containing protein n=1 Tax=Gramella sp. MAR_2010_147 TaxID=1250205 RepID=UPI00087CAA49|nr:hypothetical protein [Gramella sp. MAR_2010_147]SDR69611.1 spore coat polysaccharide biosynthesis protein SpsF [Gramella sp. MAR_2010_147]
MVDGRLNNKKIGFIIQARLKSTRLPGKVLMPIPLDSNKSILYRIIESLKGYNDSNYQIIVATSINHENDLIEDFCNSEDITCFRGEEEDVLSRFIEINNSYDFDAIVRLTGDNPIIDIKILAEEINHHLKEEFDYSYSQGLPLGMNFEIINPSRLADLAGKNLSMPEKEHVTLFFRNNKIDYSINSPELNFDLEIQKLRLTIDYPSDYLTLSALIAVGLKENIAGINLVKYCLKNYAWIFQGNINNVQKVQ